MSIVPTVRTAQPADAEPIASFTTDTFSWGDYVADGFLGWLEDTDTEVAVVTDDSGAAIGIGRVRMLSAREGWLSAARIHPDHRRRGLGSALNDWCVDWVRRQGGLVARLQVETWNEAAHHQVIRLGYREVAEVVNAERLVGTEPFEPATNGGLRVPGPERLDRAPKVEAELAFLAWSASDLSRATRSMVAVDRWTWRRMVQGDTATGAIWHCPAGWVMADRDNDELTVRWLVCTPDDAARLTKAIVDLAHGLEVDRLHVVAPALPWLVEILAEHGLEPHPSKLYEKSIT